MKKTLWASVVIALIGFMIWSNDPLNEIVNFIIAGTIPGTQLSIGLWSTLFLATLLLWLVRQGFKKTQLQMLEQTAQQIKTEQAKTEFEKTNSGEFDRSKRSVIAAPSSKTIL